MLRSVSISDTDPTPDNASLCEEVLSAGKAIFIGAHPDDIEFYRGGTIHLMRKRGADVTYVVATRGGRGRDGRALRRMEQARTDDQMDAARILGVENVFFFDYPDKALSEHVEEFAGDLRALVLERRPDVVLSWDPECIYNPHPDHQAAADAARLALDGERLVFYGTREPDLWVGFGRQAFRAKLRSIRAHRTETPWYYWPHQRRRLTERLVREGAKIGTQYAEVYRVTGGSDR